MSQPCKSAQLLQQPVRSLFFRYFRSNLVSSLMLAVYVLFDTIFIGWGIGSQGLAALNITLPCYSLEIGFAQMMGMGGATALSICRGKGEEKEGNRYFTVAVCTVVVVSTIVGILGGIFWRPIAVLEQTRRLWNWWAIICASSTVVPFCLWSTIFWVSLSAMTEIRSG